MRDGILVINKSRGMTSHDVVQLARHKLGTKRIGHAGTLDPMAEGVLVLLVGRAVRHQHTAQAHRKRYEAVIQLGTQTDTGDAWGRPVHTASIPSLNRTTVEAVLASFLGQVRQVPPTFSAVKVHGRPLYWWARRGMPLVARPRTVWIFAVKLVEFDGDRLRCRFDCSSGTYIRRLAEAIAERLGTVGHVRELVRLAVGPWDLAQARDVPWLKETSSEDAWAAVYPMDVVDASVERA